MCPTGPVVLREREVRDYKSLPVQSYSGVVRRDLYVFEAFLQSGQWVTYVLVGETSYKRRQVVTTLLFLSVEDLLV